MNKLKIAKSISTITNPPIITIPLFLIICAVLSFENGSFDFSKFIVLELISLVFSSLLPLAIILFWAKKLNTDRDISNRSDRYMPLIVGIVSYFIGFLICIFLNLDNFLTLLLLCYSVNTGVVLLFTTQWKISVHTTGLSGPVAALILLLGPVGSLFGILYPMVIWSRVLLKKHTLSQAICGGVQGFFLTVLEMYLFMGLLNKPIYGMISLEMSILFILAIILTPVLLGILSYVKVSHSKSVFYIAELVLLLGFISFTPIEVTAIFALISAASILITSLAGKDFIWNEVIF
jgi:membrane-associated phospholipid phosphatase